MQKGIFMRTDAASLNDTVYSWDNTLLALVSQNHEHFNGQEYEIQFISWQIRSMLLNQDPRYTHS